MRALIILLLLAGNAQADTLGCLYEQPGHGLLAEDGECLRAHHQANRAVYYLDDSPIQLRHGRAPVERLRRPSVAPRQHSADARPNTECHRRCLERYQADAGIPSNH